MKVLTNPTLWVIAIAAVVLAVGAYLALRVLIHAALTDDADTRDERHTTPQASTYNPADPLTRKEWAALMGIEARLGTSTATEPEVSP